MKNYDVIVIGFGKAGKTLAATLAKKGKKVALVEKSKAMYGGTCVNVACIPTKTLENRSHKGLEMKTWDEKKSWYKEAFRQKVSLNSLMNPANYAKVTAAGVTVYDGTASFVDDHTVNVEIAEGNLLISADKILINTGALPITLPIQGLENSSLVYTSETLLQRDDLPKHLVIQGSSYIALEFASIFRNFGAEVTILQRGNQFLPNDDDEVVAVIRKDLEDRGITILENATITEGSEKDGELSLSVNVNGVGVEIKANALLQAVGRKPNTEGLALEKAGVALTEKGAIQVNEKLQTTNPHIWAAGDVKGGLQFTYISLDDFRILLPQFLEEEGNRTVANRGPIPYILFIDPPFAKIGLTEKEAKARGRNVKVSSIMANTAPKAKILAQPRGILKIVLDAETEEILGAHFYCAEAHEIIHIIEVAMKAGLPYSEIRNMIFAHPVMAEALNDL